jgi:CheY-like chemotaxis protein
MSLRVLIVEDDDDSRAALHRLLTKSGHTVLAVSSVTDAIASLTFHPQVVLLDLMLPMTSGLGLLPHLRDLPAPPRVAFISANIPPMTDYSPTPVYFRKPIDFPTIAGWLRDPSAGVTSPSATGVPS